MMVDWSEGQRYIFDLYSGVMSLDSALRKPDFDSRQGAGIHLWWIEQTQIPLQYFSRVDLQFHFFPELHFLTE
jgi:hypothetical protein